MAFNCTRSARIPSSRSLPSCPHLTSLLDAFYTVFIPPSCRTRPFALTSSPCRRSLQSCTHLTRSFPSCTSPPPFISFPSCIHLTCLLLKPRILNSPNLPLEASHLVLTSSPSRESLPSCIHTPPSSLILRCLATLQDATHPVGCHLHLSPVNPSRHISRFPNSCTSRLACAASLPTPLHAGTVPHPQLDYHTCPILFPHNPSPLPASLLTARSTAHTLSWRARLPHLHGERVRPPRMGRLPPRGQSQLVRTRAEAVGPLH